MNTPERLIQWLQLMGYEEQPPTDFKPFCNPSTALIWEQLIQTVRPRDEIKRIRNNILINRLAKSKQTSCPTLHQLEDEYKFPIKEIEAWKKKQTLEKQLNFVQDQINEAQHKFDELQKQNKIKYVTIENIEANIRQTRSYIYLLEAKQKQLAEEIFNVKEMLTLACNLTPVEFDGQHDKVEVPDILKQCAVRLEKVMDNEQLQAPKPRMQTPFRSKKKGSYSVVKKRNEGRLNESLGLLDESSFSFNNALASSSFLDNNVTILYNPLITLDQNLNELIVALFKNNRSRIWNNLREVYEREKHFLIDNICNVTKPRVSVNSNTDTSFTKLYAEHVEYELKTAQVRFDCEKLKWELVQKRDSFFGKLVQHSPNIKAAIELQQKEAGLTAQMQYLHKLVNASQDTLSTVDILTAKEQVRHLDEKIIATFEHIKQKRDTYQQVHEMMCQTRDDTGILVRKLGQFTIDLNWTMPLNNGIATHEVVTFIDFPLEYNRLYPPAETEAKAKGLLDHVPFEELDSNTSLILITLLSSPWSPPETMLINLIQAKHKLQSLKSSLYVFDHNRSEYTFRDLQNQESYINYAMDKLKSLMYSDSSNKIANITKQMREIVDLWLEMPFKKFVSPKRLFNGLPYQHYEDLYEQFYQQL